MDTPNTFYESAQRLSRNPLGIIALFIALVYAIAGLILGVSTRDLTENQVTMLVLFLVLFPIVVLWVFKELVVNHHSKLYSPGDYRSDEAFLGTVIPMTVEERELKIALEQEELIEPQEPQSTATPKEGVAAETQKPPLTVREIEYLAIRHLSDKLQVPIQEQVKLVDATGSASMLFDGYFSYNGKKCVVEVLYADTTKQLRIALRKAASIVQRFSTLQLGDVKLYIVHVVSTSQTDGDEIKISDLLRSSERADKLGVDLKVEFYNVEEIRNALPF